MQLMPLWYIVVYVCCIKLRVWISCDVTDTALYVACRGRRSTSQSRVTTGALAPAPGLGLRTPGYRGNWESPKPTRSWWWMTWGQGSCYRQMDRSDQVTLPHARHPTYLSYVSVHNNFSNGSFLTVQQNACIYMYREICPMWKSQENFHITRAFSSKCEIYFKSFM